MGGGRPIVVGVPGTGKGALGLAGVDGKAPTRWLGADDTASTAASAMGTALTIAGASLTMVNTLTALSIAGAASFRPSSAQLLPSSWSRTLMLPPATPSSSPSSLPCTSSASGSNPHHNDPTLGGGVLGGASSSSTCVDHALTMR